VTTPVDDVVAAFDVDGTLTTTDTFAPFLRAVAGQVGFAVAAASLAPLALVHALGRDQRDEIKERLVHATLHDRPLAEVSRLGSEHGRRIERRWLRADTLGRLRWHQREGHRVVLVSASLRPYLEPLGASLGVDAVLCTELDVAGGGTVTGRLAGANCRGPVKRDRLLAWAGGRKPRELWAYGDSAGDDDLLALADHPVRIRRKAYIAAVPLEGVDR
jgi:HAD superfamily hydrolase (TIGR01490 family)